MFKKPNYMKVYEETRVPAFSIKYVMQRKGSAVMDGSELKEVQFYKWCDESFGSLSLGDLGGLNSSLFKKKQEHPKWDGKHRYGMLVVCQKCGRRNVTLYNVGDQKLCKACKGKEVQ